MASSSVSSRIGSARSASLARLRADAGLVAEVFWPGCAALLLTVFLVFVVAQLALDRQHARLQEARARDVLLDVRGQIEAELALGFDLEDSLHAERLLGNALRAGDNLLDSTVFDGDGRTVFDADRSAIGERVRDDWRRAAGAALWRVPMGSAVAVGAPLRGPDRTVVGQVVLTQSRPEDALAWGAAAGVATALACFAALSMILAMAGPGRALRRARDPARQRLEDAEARVAGADDALRAGPATP